MKVIIQRVLEASVEIENIEYSSIKKGLLLYICFEKEDTKDLIDLLIKKISNLRIFEDKQGKMNLNLQEVQAEILSISQFTLSWNGKKGNRPSFDLSMEPCKAAEFYTLFNTKLNQTGINTKTGKFGADMKVRSINDGPVTFSFEYKI